MRATASAKDYAERFSSGNDFDILCDEMHWSDGCDTDVFLDLMLKDAAKNGIEITGLDDFDHDKYFYDCYKNTEKGLS